MDGWFLHFSIRLGSLRVHKIFVFETLFFLFLYLVNFESEKGAPFSSTLLFSFLGSVAVVVLPMLILSNFSWEPEKKTREVGLMSGQVWDFETFKLTGPDPKSIILILVCLTTTGSTVMVLSAKSDCWRIKVFSCLTIPIFVQWSTALRLKLL